MKVLKATVQNFGSYKTLEFDFERTSLSLICGPTGSGKSTLQDIPPWILFGVTSKNGNVDEICNWKANGAPTQGEIEVDVNGVLLSVVRMRGTAAQNDLYWRINGGEAKRGKDLYDTQKILNSIMGVDADTYCIATCFNEFSDSAQFFLAKAKTRAAVFEKIAVLDVPNKIAVRSSEKRKLLKKQVESSVNELSRLQGRLEQLNTTHINLKSRYERSESDRLAAIKQLEARILHFDKEKNSKVEELETKSYRFDCDLSSRIEDLVDKLDDLDQKIKSSKSLEAKEEKIKKELTTNCPTCGNKNITSPELERVKEERRQNDKLIQKFSELSELLRESQKQKNPYKDLLEDARRATNHYKEQLEKEKNTANPFASQIEDIKADKSSTKANIEKLSAKIEAMESQTSVLIQLHDLSYDLRGALLKNVVETIQNNTNAYLSKYFDSEFSVAFDLVDADSVDVTIQKNGYHCIYKQLSKGQKQILKLCFSVAVMSASSNNSGMHFNLLMFDEALDGMDADLKLKSYGLFESLSIDHPSVLVVDHTPEFQALFGSRYKVSIESDESSLAIE